MDLLNYFDRVILVNLRSRPDRLAKVREALQQCRWPFKPPEVFEAVDGHEFRPPATFTQGPGAWGCLNSHKQILERAIADNVRNILILEDDICFIEDFPARAAEFLAAVPDDWDQLMLGGQHMHWTGIPAMIRPGVYRTLGCERTHGYAVRGPYMARLVERWTGGGQFDGNGHCDWIMGRDPDLQAKHQVYAPGEFLIGQERAKSDIHHRVTPRQFWNPPGPEMTVINLHAPAPVVAALREYGFHTGYDREPASDLDNGLVKVFAETDAPKRAWSLRQWINVIQWEVSSDPRLICTVWHPSATPALVQEASIWSVIELTATSVEEALRQLPPALRRPKMPELLLEHRFPPGHRFQRPVPGTALATRPGGLSGPALPLPAAARPPIPTTAELSKNFTKAMLGWAKAGFKTVKRKVYEQRHAICNACEHWQPDGLLGTGRCRKCGCSGVKLWLATSTCPDRPPVGDALISS